MDTTLALSSNTYDRIIATSSLEALWHIIGVKPWGCKHIAFFS